jgi:thioredoxin reductase
MVSHQGVSPRAATGLQVAIIGGSLAGCAAAIALRRAGCEVTEDATNQQA